MLYAIIVAIISLIGAAVPLRTRPGHKQLQIYLSLAAGALLGAAMFHLLPEAAHYTDGNFGLAAVAGLLLVFLLQRYVAPHSHEASPAEHGHSHEHDHAHGHEHAKDGVAAPLLPGLIAIFALSLHSFFDGVAIGAASNVTGDAGKTFTFSVVLSVLIHKPLDGLSVSVLLLNARVRRPTLWLIQLVYAGLVPVGAAAFHMTSGSISEPSLFVGYTLAFSAGTFLSIALTDLLPELQFHSHDRNKLTTALIAGLLVMYATTWFEPHGHGEPSSPPAVHSH